MLEKFLIEKRDIILESWFNQVLDSYSEDGAQFFKGKQDQFNNPVGFTISQGINTIYDELAGDMSYEILSESLENIIKIRSVQDFSASQAVAFIFLLKAVLRKQLEQEVKDSNILRELIVYEARIDQLALLAFDIYTQCREKINEIRVNEIKKRSISFFRDTQQQPDSTG